MNVLGIDFGTSSTVAVLSAFGRGPRAIEVDGSVTMSSAVFANEDGMLVVGQDAERRARLDPARFEPNPKRRIDEGTLLLGDAVIEVTDALAAVLRRIGEEAERQLSGRPDQVRISHPARWGSTRQGVLRQAAIKAGFGPSPILIPEPVAAAAHYASISSQALAPGNALAVYDLGAGTFDCAVVEVTQRGFTVLADNGLPDLGSLDIDQALLVHIGRQISHADPRQWQRLLRPETLADRRMRRGLLQDVRDAKETLSRHPHTEIPMPEPFDDVLVTRLELEALVRPNLLRSAELLAATIRDAGLAPQRLTGIYLVGGPSRMPLLASLLSDQLGVLPTTQDQPETAVAFGLHHVPVELPRSGPVVVPQAAQAIPSAPPMPVDPSARTVPAMPPVTPRVPPSWPPALQPVPPAPVAKTGKSMKKPLLAGAAVLVLVVGLVTILILANRGGDTPAAAGARETATPSGDAKATASSDLARTDGGGSCGPKDKQGFTTCLRRLAGGLPQRMPCTAGLGGLGADDLGAAVVVSCVLPAEGQIATKKVAYYQDIPYSTMRSALSSELGSPGQVLEGTWSGNGLSGKYAAGVGSLGGFVVFGTDDPKLCGMLISVNLDSEVQQKSAELVDFFKKNIKPGN
ncbi:Hsp70 family protein [Amycolatopsis cynarae]|uniref:Hsp70 family protein n=1 Tax=Amycolatopsis cynarae TaxID=2995223 RepID=A0ABY7B5E3_9PSEU|nr:Hsp70 family protein [Amycolatopsis sp. HUAS 11-8]WAL66121.1 Hsp70 family protein [Amycolatopsis sp. HUAS 11-8]